MGDGDQWGGDADKRCRLGQSPAAVALLWAYSRGAPIDNLMARTAPIAGANVWQPQERARKAGVVGRAPGARMAWMGAWVVRSGAGLCGWAGVGISGGSADLYSAARLITGSTRFRSSSGNVVDSVGLFIDIVSHKPIPV